VRSALFRRRPKDMRNHGRQRCRQHTEQRFRSSRRKRKAARALLPGGLSMSRRACCSGSPKGPFRRGRRDRARYGDRPARPQAALLLRADTGRTRRHGEERTANSVLLLLMFFWPRSATILLR
jgi:hypothetical protein